MRLESLQLLDIQPARHTETERLQALAYSGLLDSLPERAFDRLTDLARRLLNAPVALVSLVDVDRQFFKSSQGLPEPWATQQQTPLSHSFCQHVVAKREPLIISDARQNPLVRDNLAIPDLGVIAYLGIPLFTPDGQVLGSFCAIDSQPRAWSTEAIEIMQELAAVVMDEIALRIYLRERQETTLALQASQEQLQLALDGGQWGTWSCDFANDRVDYDAQARVILGLPQLVDYPINELFATAHPEDQRMIHQERATALHAHTPYAIEFRVQQPEREGRWVQVRGRPFYTREGQPWRLAGVVMDITERKAAEARVAIEHNISKILAKADTFETAAQPLLAAFCQSLQVEVGEIWTPDAADQALQRTALYTAKNFSTATAFREDTAGTRFARGSGLPGQVWQQQAAVWLAESPSVPHFAKGATANQWGLTSGFAFPILHGDQCFGIMSFFTSQALQQDPSLIEMTTAVGQLVGQFILRTRVEAQLREQEARLQMALKTAQISIWELELPSDLVTRSPSFDVVFGYPPDNAPRTVYEYLAHVHPADVEQLATAIHQALDTGSEYRVEYRIQLPDEPIRWVTMRGGPRFDETGQVLALQGALVDSSRRKVAEAELRRSEQHLRNVIDSLFGFVGVMTPDGILVEVNRTALALANLQAADVLGKPFPETYWWAYSAEVQAQMQAAIVQAAAGGTVRYDVTVRLADQQYSMIDFMLSPIFDPAGNVTYLVLSGIDITQRKLMEQALRISEERFRSTFEQAAVGIAHVAVDGTFLFVNQRLCDMLGYSEKALLQQTFQQLTYPDDLAADLAQLQRLIAGEIKGYQLEKRYFHSNSALIWGNLTVSLVHTPTGAIDYCIAVIEDISSRKAAEAALRTSETRFRAVQQTTPDGFIIFDSVRNQAGQIADFRWVYTNPAGEELLGRTAQELVGKQLLLEMPSNLIEGLFDAYVQVVESGNVWQHEYKYAYAGVQHWFRSTAAKAADGLAISFSDITAHKQAEAALRHSEAQLRQFNETLEARVAERTTELQERNLELDQFAYIASHDLKAPLRAIDNLANWIKEDAHEQLPPASQEHLRKLSGRVARMERLLDDLLAYSRAGRQRSVPEQINIGTLVRSITELIAPSEFKISLAAELPTVYVERVPLETTLRNLIGNAIKHHHDPAQGQITVAVHETATLIEFSITDNGPGIEPQFHERIFTMFQTLKPRDQLEASGMGLAIVKKMVESRGGTIVVESNIGMGATFRFSWPKSPTFLKAHNPTTDQD